MVGEILWHSMPNSMVWFAKFYDEEFSPAACLIHALKKYIKGSFAGT